MNLYEPPSTPRPGPWVLLALATVAGVPFVTAIILLVVELEAILRP